MAAKKQSTTNGEAVNAGEGGPESVGPWGTTRGLGQDAPWGVEEDSPIDEGSEPTAVSEGRRGERRAGEPAAAGGDGLGTVEPTPFHEGGPGLTPDTPGRHSFPDESSTGSLADNPIEEETGMRPEGTSRGKG
ncbi:hypothetical protein [Micromonospora sp. NBC_01796]|uniref:hypothetical protein n=1 Tax=Micromonospora sp. NBC_01796 TaxID=2975987 RepID=UPI002DDC74AD|nr:hypothetical protein [Micromonospora sp. NBC_01796]WSA84435.1 hypothetical protein OIE47_29365 [Micromonospora sp. NBC_01796]